MDGGIEAVLGELVEMVQAAAPALWAIARRQVLANTIGNAVWAGLWTLATIALGLTARYCARQYQECGPHSMWDAGAIITGFVACVTLVIALGCLNSVIMYGVSPDYYAIKALLQLVQ